MIAENYLLDNDEICISISEASYFYHLNHNSLFKRSRYIEKLRDVNVSIPIGHVQLIGPSGSGKTTLLRMLGLFGNQKRKNKFGKITGSADFNKDTYNNISLTDEGPNVNSTFSTTLFGNSNSSKRMGLIRVINNPQIVDTEGTFFNYSIYIHEEEVKAVGRTKQLFDSASEVEGLEKYLNSINRLKERSNFGLLAKRKQFIEILR